jgi:hypothetical protein
VRFGRQKKKDKCDAVLADPARVRHLFYCIISLASAILKDEVILWHERPISTTTGGKQSEKNCGSWLNGAKEGGRKRCGDPVELRRL